MDAADLVLIIIMISLFYFAVYRKSLYGSRGMSKEGLERLKRDDPILHSALTKKEFGAYEGITKWNKKTITFSVNGDYNQNDLDDVYEVYGKLGKITGLNFQQVESGADIDIKFTDRLKQAHSIVTENPQHIKGLALCSLGMFTSDLENCDITIVKDSPLEDVYNVILEESSQSLGVVHDFTEPQMKDSVFYKYKTGSKEKIKFTAEDRRILSTLYNDPRFS